MRRGSLGVGVLVGALSLAAAPAAHAASWSDEPVADPAGATATALGGVACAGASDCLAVGRAGAGSGATSLAAGWDGSAWTLRPPAAPSGAASHELTGVACSGASACTAVGMLDAGAGAVPHVQRWDGRWTVQTAPAPSGASSSRLVGVACSSASACTAVGSFTDASGTHPLALRWSGGSWSIQTVPAPTGATITVLSGVSCDTAENCTAVGTAYGPGAAAPVAIARSGGTGGWSIETTPLPSGASSSYLSGVACDAAGDCTAVGAATDGLTGDSVPLAMARTSSGWSLPASQPSLPSGAKGGWLSAVACASTAGGCTAAGAAYDADYVTTPLAGDLGASGWTAAAPPLASGATSGRLVSVACSAVQECAAVGSQVDATGAERALTELYR